MIGVTAWRVIAVMADMRIKEGYAMVNEPGVAVRVFPFAFADVEDPVALRCAIAGPGPALRKGPLLDMTPEPFEFSADRPAPGQPELLLFRGHEAPCLFGVGETLVPVGENVVLGDDGLFAACRPVRIGPVVADGIDFVKMSQEPLPDPF